MSDSTLDALLLDEHRNSLEHLRFLESKRDSFVIGGASASAAALALALQIASSTAFSLAKASPEVLAMLGLLCLSLCVLSLLLLIAYRSLGVVMMAHEKVLRFTQQAICGDQEIKVGNEMLKAIVGLDVRKHIPSDRKSVSLLSEIVLAVFSVFWFVAAVYGFYRAC